jgi:hypothetical protein
MDVAVRGGVIAAVERDIDPLARWRLSAWTG